MRKITVNGVQWYWVVTGGTVFITNKQPGSTPIRLAKTTIGEAASYHCEWCGGGCIAEHNQGAWKITPKHIRAAILNHATILQQPARRGKKPATRTRSVSYNARAAVSRSSK